MSSKVPIAYVDVRVFAHATEDVEKVLSAVCNVLPPDSADKVTFSKVELAGHHGNPIVLLEARIKDRKLSQGVLEKLAEGLSILDKELLSREVEQHFDRGNLYLRLDKQAAYQKSFRLSTVDAIHIQIHFRRHSMEEVIETCRKYGLLP